MSDQEHSWTTNLGDVGSWFDDGNYRFRLFVEPARFPIAQVLAAEAPQTYGGRSRDRKEQGLSRKRDRAADRDPRWQVVLARKRRDTFVQLPGVVYAELVESAEAGNARRRAMLGAWQPGQSFVDVRPSGFHWLRRWIRQTPGCATMPMSRSTSAPLGPEPFRPVRWWARHDGTITLALMTFASAVTVGMAAAIELGVLLGIAAGALTAFLGFRVLGRVFELPRRG